MSDTPTDKELQGQLREKMAEAAGLVQALEARGWTVKAEISRVNDYWGARVYGGASVSKKVYL